MVTELFKRCHCDVKALRRPCDGTVSDSDWCVLSYQGCQIGVSLVTRGARTRCGYKVTPLLRSALNASSVNIFKNRIDRYLIRAGYK